MPEDDALLPEAAEALSAAFGADAAGAEVPAAGQTLDDVRRFVAAHVARLLDHNPALLMHVLYRVDVPEAEVRRAFAEAPPAALADRLAELLVARQLDKLATRRRYRDAP